MAKRRNVIFGVVVFLLVAGVVAVIVLAALGYFKKKTPGGGSSGTNTNFRPNANYVGPTANLDPTPGVHPTGGYAGNCDTPLEITNVTYMGTLFTVYLSPSTPYYSCGRAPGYWTLQSANDNYEKSANIQAVDGAHIINFTPDQLPTPGGKNTGILRLSTGIGVHSKPFNFPLHS